MSKSILQTIYSIASCVQKTATKNTKYSRNERILKIGRHAKAIAHAKTHFGSKVKIEIKLPKSILQIINTSFVQKTARKSTKYARNKPF